MDDSSGGGDGELEKALRDNFGFPKFRSPQQREAVRQVRGVRAWWPVGEDFHPEQGQNAYRICVRSSPL